VRHDNEVTHDMHVTPDNTSHKWSYESHMIIIQVTHDNEVTHVKLSHTW
jgi:hypothetical protein